MSPATQSSANSKPLRVLSLDGGGVRGLSSLLILENIMECIKTAGNLNEVPKPCDWFDLIGGTSTGGIIAIMLGRLGMTVDQSIRAYKKFAQTAFTTQQPRLFQRPWPTTFSDINLENAIKQMIQDSCTQAPCVELRQLDNPVATTCTHEDLIFHDRSCTDTAVLALTQVNVETVPTLLRTYDRSDGFTGCKIWEVARATSAAASFFSPIEIGRDSVKFIDANFGFNNPCEILIEEAKKKSSPDRPMIITSIGTGLGNVIEIRDTKSSVIEALKAMASTSKQATLRLENEYRNIIGLMSTMD